jgi:hypothetical protein
MELSAIGKWRGAPEHAEGTVQETEADAQASKANGTQYGLGPGEGQETSRRATVPSERPLPLIKAVFKRSEHALNMWGSAEVCAHFPRRYSKYAPHMFCKMALMAKTRL